MPYIISQNSAGKFCVHKQAADGKPGETVHCHETEEMAKQQMRALYAAEKKALELLDDALKVGARNNAGDAARLQQIHDAAVECGAKCEGMNMGDMEGKSADDTLIYYGGNVKLLGRTADGGLHVGGYLVQYGSTTQTDMSPERDFFKAETDYGAARETDVFYHHRQPLPTKDGGYIIVKKKIGHGTLTKDDVGVFIDAVTFNREEYQKKINEVLTKTLDKHGWSSGTAGHLVDREPQPNGSNFIKAWPLGLDASLTPTPAEPRNTAIPLKSFAQTPGRAALDGAGDVPPTTSEATKGASPMSEPTTAPAPSDEMAAIKAQMDALAKQNAELLTELRKPTLPAKTAGNVTEVKDLEAEKPFETIGEQIKAVIKTTTSPHMPDKRLLHLNAQYKAVLGMNEGVGSEGGFAVQPTFNNNLMERTYATGQLLSRMTPQEIGPNSNEYSELQIDDTTRVSGSQFGGVTVYWLGEGGTITATKPTLKRFALKLKKVAALTYLTDEAMEDAVQLTSAVNRIFPQAMAWEIENRSYRGTDAAGPQGILTAAGAVSVVKESGQAATTVVFKNIVKMLTRLWAPSLPNAVWLLNQDVLEQLYSMSIPVGTGGVPVLLPPTGISGSPYGTLYGRPMIPFESCSTLGTKGDIALVDASQILRVYKGGVNYATSMHVAFLTDQMALRWTQRINTGLTWSSAITPAQGSNSLSPVVFLDTRS